MRHAILLFVAFASFAAGPASAQKLLPGSFAGWTAASTGGFTPGAPGTPGDVARSSAEATAAREYGFQSGEQASYTRGNDAPIQVTLYRMKDPSGAYGEYLYLRQMDMTRADLADYAALSREHALVLTGNVVLDIRGADLSRDEHDFKALVAAVSPHAESGPLPPIAEHLPAKGMVERSDHYFLGPVTLNQFFPVSTNDWLGFSNGAEAEVARYRLDGRELNLLIVDFPTPQIAGKKLRDIEQNYYVNSPSPAANGLPVFAKRSMTMLAIVSGARSQAESDKLLTLVQSGGEITWNEPTFQFKEPPISAMIVGTIMGAGVICMFAIISGIAFGGLRLIVKRFFPDKVFDRSSHLQVLQLGLGSKPINAEDFYGIERKPPS